MPLTIKSSESGEVSDSIKQQRAIYPVMDCGGGANEKLVKEKKMSKPETIKIDDIEYVRKDQILQPAPKVDGMEYCIVRTYSAGVFAGYIKERNGKEATLLNARRLWKWSGAATLSQLAMEGTSKPSDCKFPCEVRKVVLTEAIEVIPCTKSAQDSIQGVKIWKA